MEIKKEWYKNNLPIKSNDEHAVSVLGEFLQGDSKVIGLMGDYGAGKSSIIKKLEEENKEFIFYILSIPNYLDPKKIQDSKSYDIKREVRKSISMQLISLFEADSEINIIKKKLYMHTFEKITYKELVAFSIVILLPIINMNSKYLIKNYKFVKHNQEWLFLVGFAIFATALVFALFKLGTYIKNSKLTDFNINNIGFKQEQPQTYIDYDLETIVALITINAQKIRNSKLKDIVIIIEDVDRYKSKEIFQEIMHIINACTDTKFIIPMKPGMFEDATEQSKYFDSQYSVLPVNDKINRYEYIEETLNEHQSITVDAAVLMQTSPYIEDFRTFHTIYNKYLSLLANYLKVDSEPSRDKLNSIYAIAVLQVFLPNDLKNDGVENTCISQFLETIFSKQKLETIITESYKNNIEENEKLLKDLKVKNLEIESQIEDLKKLEYDKVLKLLNYHLCAECSSIEGYTTVKIDNSNHYIRDVRANIIRGTMYSLDQLQQIVSGLTNYDISLLDFEKFIDEGKQKEFLKEKEYNNLEQSELINRNKSLKETLAKQKNDLQRLSCSEIIIKYELDKYVKDIFESYIPIEKEHITKYKVLIINLIMNGLFNDEYKKYISILKDEIPTVKLREFKYDVSGELESYVFINDENIEFKIEQGFIDSFSLYEFSKAKFVRKDIIEFLINNIDMYENRKKFHKIIDQLCKYISNGEFFKFDDALVIHTDKQTEVLLLLEHLLSFNELIKESRRDIDLYLKLMELCFVCNSNMNINWLNNLISSICEDSETVNINLDVLYPGVLWNYIEYNIDEISEKAFLNLMNYFEKGKVQTKADNGIFNNIETVFSTLEKYQLENVEEFEEVIVTKKVFVYNYQNVEFLLKNKKLSENILMESDEEFVKYICNNKMQDVAIDINRLYKKPLIKNSIDNLLSLCTNYSFKILNLSELISEIADVIINEKLYAVDITNKLYLIDNRKYKDLLENFDFSNEVFTITKEEAVDILKYLDETENDESSINNFINNLDYKYNVNGISNMKLLKLLIEENRVEGNISSYNYIKGHLPDCQFQYILNIGYNDLLEFELDTSEYDDILIKAFKSNNYDLINNLYPNIANSKFNIVSHKFNVDVNVQILLNNNLDAEHVRAEISKYKNTRTQTALKDRLLKKSIDKFLTYFIPRFCDIETLSGYINEKFDIEEKLVLVINMACGYEINKIEELISVMKKLEIWDYFEFPPRGRGTARDMRVVLDIEKDVFDDICEVLLEFNYIKNYSNVEEKIYRK